MGGCCSKEEPASGERPEVIFSGELSESANANIQEPPGSAEAGLKLFEAVFAFESQNENDMSFNVGEHLLVLQDTTSDNWGSRGWCLAKRPGSNDFKFVPMNHLAAVYDGADYRQLLGYHEFTREEAERELFKPDYQHGTYILRPSSNSKPAISVKVCKTKAYVEFYHFLIHSENDSGTEWFFIENGPKFDSFQKLLQYYSLPNRGIKCTLNQPIRILDQSLLPLHEYKIDESRLRFGEKIGNGQFGTVFKAKLMGRIPVAVKKITFANTDSSEEKFRREAEMHYKLRHKNIISLISICEPRCGDQLWLVMEFAAKGSLKKNVKRIRDLQLLVDFIRQLLCGMKYLEEMGFVHRDLRADNVLLTDRDVIKISDFGLTRIIGDHPNSDGDQVYVCSGENQYPIRWTAPEAIKDAIFSSKSDVWSFGVCAYEILSQGGQPYKGLGNFNVRQYVLDGNKLENPLRSRFSEQDEEFTMSEFLYEELLLPCWNFNPNERPTFSALYERIDETSEAFDDFVNRYPARNQRRVISDIDGPITPDQIRMSMTD